MGSVLGPTVKAHLPEPPNLQLKIAIHCKFGHISDARYIRVRNRNKLPHLTDICWSAGKQRATVSQNCDREIPLGGEFRAATDEKCSKENSPAFT